MKQLLLIISLLLFTEQSQPNSIYNVDAASLRTSISILDLPTINNIREYLIEIDIESPDIVLKQIILETGWLSSGLCKRNNNLIGMNFPSKRNTTASGYTITSYGYKIAKYDTWKDCIEDIKLYQEYYINKGVNITNYYDFLSRNNYSESTNYIQVLKTIKI